MSRGLGPLCSGPGESPYTLCTRLACIAGGGRYCSEHSYLLPSKSGWTPPPEEITGAWVAGHYHAVPSRAPKLGGVQPAPARFESEGTWFSEQARAERAECAGAPRDGLLDTCSTWCTDGWLGRPAILRDGMPVHVCPCSPPGEYAGLKRKTYAERLAERSDVVTGAEAMRGSALQLMREEGYLYDDDRSLRVSRFREAARAAQKLADAQAAMIKMAGTYDTALATQRTEWQKDRAKLEEIRALLDRAEQTAEHHYNTPMQHFSRHIRHILNRR